MDSASAEQLSYQQWRVCTWIICALLAIVFFAAAGWDYVLIGLGIVTVGVGHGGADHYIPQRVLREIAWLRPYRVAVLYALATGAAFLAYLALPKIGYIALLVMACWHFGEGDAAFSAACEARVPAIGEAFVRGILPVSIGALRLAESTTFGICAICFGIGLLQYARGTLRASSLADLALLVALLVCLPWGVGFAIYFVGWHAMRHIARVVLLFTPQQKISAGIGTFLRAAAPTTVLAVTAGLCLTASTPSLHIDGLTLLLAGIFAVTVPHEIIVGIMRAGEHHRKRQGLRIACTVSAMNRS